LREFLPIIYDELGQNVPGLLKARAAGNDGINAVVRENTDSSLVLRLVTVQGFNPESP
jgi:hypothetical protein